MNPYQLADALEDVEPYSQIDDLTLKNSSFMLREQADRLMRLEKKIKLMELSNDEIDAVAKETWFEDKTNFQHRFARAILKKASEK